MLLLLISQFFFDNSLYLVAGTLVFGFMIYKMQRPYAPSVFTVIFIYHFIQISAWVWKVNYLGVDINYKSPHSGLAVLLAYVGLICIMAPVIYFQNKLPVMSFKILKAHAGKLSINKTFIAYIAAFFTCNALAFAALTLAGLSQVVLSLVNVKWFFFLLFGFQVVLKKKMFKEFGLFILIEFGMGFFSYFSNFKLVFFYLACLSLTFLVKVTLKQLIYGLLSISIAAFLAITWTGVKGQYRTYLNQGSNTQTIQVSQGEALNKLVNLVNDQKESDEGESTNSLFDRLQYTWHLAKSMDHVPSVVPYQNGDNWLSSISFALTPRYFNPDKPFYEASKKATKYTGISYLGANQGVSFSLGYFADSYVDFGYFGMFLPLLLIGFLYGITYFYFLKHSSSNFIFNYAVVGALFMEFNALEMDSTYLAGRLFSDLLIFFLLRLFFFPWLIKYLANEQADIKY